jgi:hypothetical protein
VPVRVMVVAGLPTAVLAGAILVSVSPPPLPPVSPPRFRQFAPGRTVTANKHKNNRYRFVTI